MAEGCSAMDALAMEAACFMDLLSEKALLGLERQIGLLGELLFLEELVKRSGPLALDSWIGPAGEPHDFRLQTNEFEIKTSVAARRVHTIHGWEQLVPSEGCHLHVISILLGPPGAGAGFSLRSKVDELRPQLRLDPVRAARFSSALEACGFHGVDSSHYARSYVLRRPLAIIPVDSSFPSITRPAVQRILGSLAARVDSLQYDVDVEGLER
jgi:hypothetical protein